MRTLTGFLFLLFSISATAQLTELTVEKIMRDPKWIGTAPSNIRWSHDSKTIYFNWNPENAPGDSLYKITLQNRAPQKVSKAERLSLPASGPYNKAFTKMVYENNGDIFLLDIPSNKTTQITNTTGRESNPSFSGDEKKIIYTYDQNLYAWEIGTGNFTQLTDFKRGKKPAPPVETEQQKWLKQDQLAYIQILKERKDNREATRNHQKTELPKRPKEIYLDDKMVGQARLSPDGNYVTFALTKNANAKNTIVPNYVTESGFTEDLNTRTKVGAPQNTQEFFVYDIKRDTVLQVKTEEVPGINDVPAYLIDAKKEEGKDKKPQARAVSFFGPVYSDDGKHAVVQLRAADNKDRWIMLLNVATQKLSLIDRQHDDAWVGGPGSFTFGWITNNELYFASEESGYAHLYTYTISTKNKKALTSGKYEVQQVTLSRDKKNFYLITNEVHPGEKHFYKLPVTGGKAERLTTTTGANEVTLSPDEKMLAIRYSYSNKPWELFLQENKTNAKPQQITNSLTNEFKSYAWRDPVLTTFKARDGADVYTRLYKPEKPNGAAVIFVHGAGYLQNAHKWWSSYFREYMFHNLLVDKGYTVIDLDYRASAGYGRDWRTGIYQFMGGKDLTDHVDGAAWLVKEHGIDAKRIGIYGGSYGGFITLMGMFTTPDVFAAGAALRPVTDWAHYNHPYTSNILNLPYSDSVAYAKSSPIYHAEGLKGALLMCHGMIDVNVHFQDVVRLSQRLIELGKDNWELAVYPLEDHGFVEPSSWTDEYKRILKLFEDNLR
ncbi:MAG: S9 family peptidase [Cyclobacteriaceae bacterium]|nr:S9 family peptidase [Cyclobacteriaceae bacterium]UYN86791.1 MAG: S9 family peptidase [Cyclobacteriaceae bacterium]